MRRLSLALSISLFTVFTQAAPYSFEVDAQYSEVDESDYETEAWIGAGRYYFQPVDDSGGPLAEAAFLSQSSFVELGYRDFEEEGALARPRDLPLPPPPDVRINPGSIPIDALGFDLFIPSGQSGLLGPVVPINAGVAIPSPVPEGSRDGFNLGGSYVHRESGWLIGGSYANLEGDTDFCLTRDESETDRFAIVGGKYITPRTLLTLSYLYEEEDRETYQSFVSFLGAVPDGPSFFNAGLQACGSPDTEIKIMESSLETSGWDLTTRHVGTVGPYGFAVAVSAAIADIDRETEFVVPQSSVFIGPTNFSDTLDQWSAGLKGTVYLTSALGLSASYEHLDQDYLDTDIYGAGIEWFVLDQLAVRIDYLHSDYDASYLRDQDTWTVGLRGRF